MKETLKEFAKLEVKAALADGSAIWLGTASGLYRYDPAVDRKARAIPGWAGRTVSALGRAANGFCLASEKDGRSTVFRCDATGKPLEEIAAPDGDKIKAILDVPGLRIGTKRGVYHLAPGGWEQQFGAQGPAEITRLWSVDGRLFAAIKKLGPKQLPALIESGDGGRTWSVEAMPDYQDAVVAADTTRIATRWRGARPRRMPGEYKKHPITAAWIGDEGTAVVDGDKLEIQLSGGGKVAAHHPIFGEAEHVHLVPGGAVVAGPQGAYRATFASGRVDDLLDHSAVAGVPGKAKRLYVLDRGALLATTTFGAFRSTDGGESWTECRSEWAVLDAEALVRAESGRWWLLCQRGLFRSDDNGVTWVYEKFKVKNHERHYGEYRSLAVLGNLVAVGTKAGLFVDRSDKPNGFSRVERFGTAVIEALSPDGRSGRLLVGTADGEVVSYDPALGTTDKVVTVPVNESTLLGDASHLLIHSKDRIHEAIGRVARDVTPAGAAGSLHVAACADRLLAWDSHRAWTRTVDHKQWHSVPGWPAGVRHASIDIALGVAYTTDRTRLARVALS